MLIDHNMSFLLGLYDCILNLQTNTETDTVFNRLAFINHCINPTSIFIIVTKLTIMMIHVNQFDRFFAIGLLHH